MHNLSTGVLLGTLLLGTYSSNKALSLTDLLGANTGQQITTLIFGAAGAYTFGEVLYRRWQKLQKNNDPNKPDVQEFLEGLTQDFADQAGLVTQDNLEAKVDEIIAKKYPHVANPVAFRAAVVEVIKQEFDVQNPATTKR